MASGRQEVPTMTGKKVTVVQPAAAGDFRTVKFQADSALIRELGERLVGQPHIALAELIKNAYDADATLCNVVLDRDTIIVTDNGHGMTEDEFLQHWMIIGTRNKQERGTSRTFGRNVTGSKGVGRLSAQFLAHDLEIITASTDETHRQLHATVDWDRAIEAGRLTEAEALYRMEPKVTTFASKSRHGTQVIMKGLKQKWEKEDVITLGRQLWMMQSPLPAYGRLTTQETDPDAFRVELSSWREDLADSFERQMTAALRNYDAIISGEIIREGDTAKAHVKVSFLRGATYSEFFEVAPLIEAATWSVRIFRLHGRQFEGVTVGIAREYFERFGGVQVYDAGFRLPYYGVEQDWLGIEYDHSHRRNKSALLPERLHVRRALNDLPTQGRMFGVVRIDTGREARSARGPDQKSGEYLKIQVTRDRLVANQAYAVLRSAVRWSLDYYATRERLREEGNLDLRRPEEPSTDKVGRARNLAAQARQEHPEDDIVYELEREIDDLSQTIAEEKRADDAARSLLGPLAAAGMAALALEHESRKEMRLVRGLVRRLRSVAKETGDIRMTEIADQVGGWADRLESTRRVFAPLLDTDDRDKVEALSVAGVVRHVLDNVTALIPGIGVEIAIPRDIVLPPATFAEWNSLFQNIFVNAANATLDTSDRRILCSGGRTGREAWVRISDTGAGIDWEHSDALFEPFTRHIQISDERRSLGLGGMGLGLTIVRMIADQRRCKVRFIRPAEGWATTFQLSWSSAR